MKDEPILPVHPSSFVPRPFSARRWLFYVLCLSFAVALSGCSALPEYFRNGLKVGPNYTAPAAPLAKEWIDAADLRKDGDDLSQWWTVFEIPDPKYPKLKRPDPVLNELILSVYRQNLTLREAGFRILQARAQLAITVGGLFPQAQFADGSFSRSASSRETVSAQFLRQRYFSQWDHGFNLAWEVDFWGRFRRAVESASATLDASVHDYDDVIVTLLADVATAYVQIRVTEERIEYAKQNIEIQRETHKVAESKQKAGTGLEVDTKQAIVLLKQTEATIPELEINLRRAMNRLCTLLGTPPEDLQKKLGTAPIPTAEPRVAIGIPADLLRRRPDVRRAERLAAAQSAQIGVAKSDFYPHIFLTGSFGFSAEKFQNIFSPTAFSGRVGPGFEWKALNYGRVLNNVRLQDARFQELLTAYQNQVLVAQQEVENGLITFLKAQERTKLQGEGAKSAAEVVKIVDLRYKAVGGDKDPANVTFTRVTQVQQLKVQADDLLAQSKGEIALGLIQIYKALGGGWRIRCVDGESPAVVEELPPPRPVFGRPQ
ncbi:MAG: TolC family protein [Gemmataceae bacterium]|nr:TolC family protein [Gemmataceae bacterium]